MINSRVITPAISKEVIYPYLGINDLSGKIVLFHKPNSGMLIAYCKSQINANDTIGTYFDSWSEEAFKPFFGIVEIKNTMK